MKDFTYCQIFQDYGFTNLIGQRVPESPQPMLDQFLQLAFLQMKLKARHCPTTMNGSTRRSFRNFSK